MMTSDISMVMQLLQKLMGHEQYPLKQSCLQVQEAFEKINSLRAV